MSLHPMLTALGPEIQDPEEESFLLFSQGLPPAQNLGFLDSKATELSVPLGPDGPEYTIIQSPTLLSSSLSTGTTGAVLWKVTPLFAAWLSSADNFLFAQKWLSSESTILELGCGIAGIIAMAVAPKIGEYICTDQEYVMKHLRRNLEANKLSASSKASSSSKRARSAKNTESRSDLSAEIPYPNTRTLALDWETSNISSLPSLFESIEHLDAVVACDCIYNSHLIAPFVNACADLCRLRAADHQRPTLCVVAQQLRSDEVFEEWLKYFMREFKVWQVQDDRLIDGLRPIDGFVVHVGILKSRLDDNEEIQL